MNFSLDPTSSSQILNFSIENGKLDSHHNELLKLSLSLNLIPVFYHRIQYKFENDKDKSDHLTERIHSKQ